MMQWHSYPVPHNGEQMSGFGFGFDALFFMQRHVLFTMTPFLFIRAHFLLFFFGLLHLWFLHVCSHPAIILFVWASFSRRTTADKSIGSFSSLSRGFSSSVSVELLAIPRRLLSAAFVERIEKNVIVIERRNNDERIIICGLQLKLVPLVYLVSMDGFFLLK